MSSGVLSGGLVDGGGRLAGMGLLVLAGVQLFRFVLTFLAGRWDATSARALEREKLADSKIGERLKHLEEAERFAAFRMRNLEEAIQVLIGEVVMVAPHSPKLRQVAEILGRPYAAELKRAFSRIDPVPDDMNDSLGDIR